MIGAAVKGAVRAMGAARKPSPALAENATREARVRLDDARADLERTETRQAESIANAREVFNADPSDSNADAVTQAERRADVLIKHGRQRVTVCDSAFKQAEQAECDAKVAELDAQVAGLKDRLADLAATLAAPMATIAAAANQRDELVRAAERAFTEAAKLRDLPAEKRNAGLITFRSGGWRHVFKSALIKHCGGDLYEVKGMID